MNTVSAIATGVRMSPRKVGEVAALVRGRTVADAQIILDHTPRRAALPVKKLIASAAANAVNNNKFDEKSLIVSELIVQKGFSIKRYRPIARGSAHPYRKHTANLRVVLTGAEKKPATKKTAEKKTTSASKEEAK